MKRICFVLLVWAVFVGGLTWYMHRRDAVVHARSPGAPAVAAAGTYTVELTPSFTPTPDQFVLHDETPIAIAARFRGQPLDLPPSEAGKPILTTPLPGVAAGPNEILVSATPSPDDSGRHFLQARVLRNGIPVAADTFWADGYERVTGALYFTAPANDGTEAGHAR